MGSVLSQAGKSPVLKWGTRNPREATFVGWVSLVLVLQQYERLTSRTSGGEHVKIKGQLFKQSAGGEVNLGASGSMEYYVTTLIRVFETYGMYKAGERFFMPDKNGEGGVVSRFRGLLFAAFVLLPVLDLAVPKDWANPRKEEQTTKKGDRKFRIPLYMWAVMEVLTTFKVLQVASNPKTKLTAMQQAACVGSLAVFNGAVGINASHELVHKASKLEKFLSYMMLANVNYVHWGWEHTHGRTLTRRLVPGRLELNSCLGILFAWNLELGTWKLTHSITLERADHENVATPGDPASSRLGESFYSFLPRTLFGTWWSAWKIEQGRLDQSGEHRVLQNRMAWGAMVPFLWASVIAKASGGGAKAYALFYAQGLGSAVLLELVNYLEHYGLQRKLVTNPKDPAGEPIYEAVNPTHSWNAPHRLSNAFLFKLQRHR